MPATVTGQPGSTRAAIQRRDLVRVRPARRRGPDSRGRRPRRTPRDRRPSAARAAAAGTADAVDGVGGRLGRDPRRPPPAAHRRAPREPRARWGVYASAARRSDGGAAHRDRRHSLQPLPAVRPPRRGPGRPAAPGRDRLAALAKRGGEGPPAPFRVDGRCGAPPPGGDRWPRGRRHARHRGPGRCLYAPRPRSVLPSSAAALGIARTGLALGRAADGRMGVRRHSAVGPAGPARVASPVRGHPGRAHGPGVRRPSISRWICSSVIRPGGADRPTGRRPPSSAPRRHRAEVPQPASLEPDSPWRSP